MFDDNIMGIVIVGIVVVLFIAQIIDSIVKYHRTRNGTDEDVVSGKDTVLVDKYNEALQTAQVYNALYHETLEKLEGYQKGHLYTEKDLKEATRKSLQSQKGIIRGSDFEAVAPFMKEMPGHRKDLQYLGNPVDFICFDGKYESGDISRIVFVEVKSGNSKLNQNQRQIKKCIEEGRVEFLELREDGKSKETTVIGQPVIPPSIGTIPAISPVVIPEAVPSTLPSAVQKSVPESVPEASHISGTDSGKTLRPPEFHHR